MINSESRLALAGQILSDSNKTTGLNQGAKSRVSRHIADLQWQIRFADIKLNAWKEHESCRWMSLVRWQEQAKRELSAVAC